jgi:Fe-S cluster assembly ATP-binding protein
MSLFVKNLTVNLGDKTLLKNISFEVENGKISFLLGRNGAGKSTLAQSILGDSSYVVSAGEILLNNENITKLTPEDKSEKGLFVSFQHPPEIEGVSLMSFLHTIYIEKFGNEDPLARSTFKFRKHILSLLERVNLNPEFIDRSLNVGFSGGEKKRCEILQMLLLKPNTVILDEIDSGLDIHAFQILESAVKEMVENGAGVLYITHNVDFVKRYDSAKIYILEKGEIVAEGNNEVLMKFTETKNN